MFFVVLVATLYGMSDEWHQSFVHGRDASGFDVLADAAGALLVSVFLFREAFTVNLLRNMSSSDSS